MTRNDSAFQTNPDVPSELSGPVPRRIRPSPDTRYMEIVYAVILGLTIIFSFLICKSDVHKMQLRSALRLDGVEVQGEITFLGRAGRGGDVVRYTFTANGEDISGNAEVPLGLVLTPSLYASKFLTIRYLPSNPAFNHPAAWEWEWSLWDSVGIIFLMIIMSILGAGNIMLYRLRQLLSWGNPVVAVVTDCSPANRAFSVKYEFRTEDGTFVKGTGNSAIRQEIGARICVLYLPQNPRRNCLYPSSDYCVDADTFQ